MEYIYEAHNILPKTFCKEMIEKFESDSRRRQGELQGGAIDHDSKKMHRFINRGYYWLGCRIYSSK